MHSGQYAFRDRRQKKRDFRKLWITRINAACRQNDISYSRFIEGLNKAGVEINRKMLSEIAISDPKAFTELVKISRDGKNGKIAKNEETNNVEVVVGEAKNTKKATTKATEKKEPAKKTTSKKENTDYSKMTVAELKELATKKKISITGMKKAEIIEALQK